jgi:hypothetical protein
MTNPKKTCSFFYLKRKSKWLFGLYPDSALFWVISSTTGDLHLAANRDDETIIALAVRLVPKMTTKFAMFTVNKSTYNLPFKVSLHKENEEVVGFIRVIGNGA